MNIIPIEYKQAMNIEHGDIKWPCRFLFAFLFILNMAVNFIPYASSDFDALINYVYNGTEDLTSIYDLPITQGNIIYLVTRRLSSSRYPYTGSFQPFSRKNTGSRT